MDRTTSQPHVTHNVDCLEQLQGMNLTMADQNIRLMMKLNQVYRSVKYFTIQILEGLKQNNLEKCQQYAIKIKQFLKSNLQQIQDIDIQYDLQAEKKQVAAIILNKHLEEQIAELTKNNAKLTELKIYQSEEISKKWNLEQQMKKLKSQLKEALINTKLLQQQIDLYKLSAKEQTKQSQDCEKQFKQKLEILQKQNKDLRQSIAQLCKLNTELINEKRLSSSEYKTEETKQNQKQINAKLQNEEKEMIQFQDDKKELRINDKRMGSIEQKMQTLQLSNSKLPIVSKTIGLMQIQGHITQRDPPRSQSYLPTNANRMTKSLYISKQSQQHYLLRTSRKKIVELQKSRILRKKAAQLLLNDSATSGQKGSRLKEDCRMGSELFDSCISTLESKESDLMNANVKINFHQIQQKNKKYQIYQMQRQQIYRRNPSNQKFMTENEKQITHTSQSMIGHSNYTQLKIDGSDEHQQIK